MSGIGKILGIILIVLSLGFGILGAAMPLYVVPEVIEPAIDEEIESATFPTDFDEYNVYGGYIDALDFSTGDWEKTNMSISRRIQTIEELGDGRLLLDENIRAIVNGTDIEIDSLTKHNQYEIDELTIQLFEFNDILNNVTVSYTEEDEVQWIFPHPLEEGDEFNVFNMNILDYSGSKYLGKEEVYGIECFVYRGEEINYEIPLPASIAASLGSLAAGSRMELTLWEKAWVHPITGSIIDYAKEIQVFLYLPELPEIRYPSDLTSTTGFDGDLVLFDQATASFQTFDGIQAERYIEVVSADGDDLTANETVTVTTADGIPLSLLDSSIQVVFDAKDGSHQGPGRIGQYLFPILGAGEMNYSIWDDGFGKEVNAEFTGKEMELFAPLSANVYHIFVENETYLAGGIATLDMTYWVEPNTGVVLDVNKKVTNWRPQDARRLPLDTAMINKTVTMNTTITSYNPIEGTSSPMEIYVEQIVNCTGYTNATFQVAKFQETVTKYLMDGTMMAPPTVSQFGVDARTMEYVDVDGWSDVTRTGVYTFPIGLLNETGDVTPMFMMYNSDLDASLPVMLVGEMEMNGLNVAKYEMNYTTNLTLEQVIGILGQDPGLPGATGTYGCLFEYYVDVNTGTIVDIVRSVAINLVPPSTEFLYDNLDSTLVLFGQFNGENLTATQMISGEDFGEGYTLLTINETYLLDDGTPLFPDVNSQVIFNQSSYQATNETFIDQGAYVFFPPNPTQMDEYLMVQNVAGIDLYGYAVKDEMTTETVNYTWMNQTMVDGGLINPLLTGTNWTMTMTYEYTLDIMTGVILDAKADIQLVDLNETMPDMSASLAATEQTKMGFQLSNAVIGWSMLGTHAPVLDIAMDLYDMEAEAAVMKAMATSQLLLIADGVKPALELELTFNATTKATMLLTAQGTLEQVTALKGAQMLDMLLTLNGNKVQHIYYKKVDTDVGTFEGIDGSVEYWAEKAQETEDDIEAAKAMFESTLPVFLFILAGICLVVGLVLVFATGKRTEGAEE